MPTAPAEGGRSGLVLALGLAALWAVALPLLRPVLPVDETRYLTVAWEMHTSGSYIVPHLNGAIYTHKPPLLFWLINLVWSVTGISEAAARVVAPAFGLLAVALTWALGRRLWPEERRIADHGALILASTGVFALYGSLTMFDTMLTSAVLTSVLALTDLDRGRLWRGIGLLGLALGFGVFAKGPVILVHLMPLALLWPLWRGEGARLSYGRWLLCILAAIGLALLIVGLWLGPALVFGGEEYRNDVLWRQSAGRVVNAFDHGRPVWFFVVLLPLLAWPWAWRPSALRGLSLRQIRAEGRTRMLGLWFVATVLLFSLIESKQVHYMLPVLPPLALLLARAPSPRPGRAPLWLALAILGPFLVWGLLLATGKASFGGTSVATEMTGPLGIALGLSLAVAAGLLLAGRRAPALGWALVTPAVLIVVHVALTGLTFGQFDAARFAALLREHEAGGLAYVGGKYQGEFGFAGRLTTPIAVLAADQVAPWAAAHPDGLLVSAGRDPLALPLVLEANFGGDHLRFYHPTAP